MKYKIITPTITALDKNGKVDIVGNKKIVRYLIDNGVDGLAPLGSTGEFTEFSISEKKELFKAYIEESNGEVEIIAGTSSLNFDEVVELSNYALEIGVNGVLILPPYYFSISQEEVYRWYDELAKRIKGDIYIYNFEDRSGFNISTDTLVRLVKEHNNIVGLKDSTMNPNNTTNLINCVKKIRYDFKVYSGFDNQFLNNVMSGGDGNISALSNIEPKLWSNWVKYANEGNYIGVSKIQKKIDELMFLYNVQSNFSLLFKKMMIEDGIEINSLAIFPFDEISEEDYKKANRIRKEITK